MMGSAMAPHRPHEVIPVRVEKDTHLVLAGIIQ